MLGFLFACQTPDTVDTSILAPVIDQASTWCDPVNEVWESEVRVSGAYSQVLEARVELATATISESHDLQLVSWDPNTGEQHYTVTIAIQSTPVSDSGVTFLSCNDDVSASYYLDP
jgi:hypothetical protein